MNDGDGELDSDGLYGDSGESPYSSPLVRELRRLKKLDNYQRRGYEFQELVASLSRR
jgi:hypothetical protein